MPSIPAGPHKPICIHLTISLFQIYEKRVTLIYMYNVHKLIVKHLISRIFLNDIFILKQYFYCVIYDELINL